MTVVAPPSQFIPSQPWSGRGGERADQINIVNRTDIHRLLTSFSLVNPNFPLGRFLCMVFPFSFGPAEANLLLRARAPSCNGTFDGRSSFW